MHTVHVTGKRPDYRVFIGLLFGDSHNVDTEGNSRSVHSRTWTYLYIQDRESDEPSVEIISREGDTFFDVRSESTRLEELAALYLKEFCGSSITYQDRILSDHDLARLASKYRIELESARNSIWHQSSARRPYPNLKIQPSDSVDEPPAGKGNVRPLWIVLWVGITLPLSYLVGMGLCIILGVAIFSFFPDVQWLSPGLPYVIAISLLFSLIPSLWVLRCSLRGQLPGTKGHQGDFPS